MAPAITKAGWIRLLIVTVVGVCLLPFAPGPKQFWNLHLARIYADKLKPSLLSDPRFRHITVDAYTGGGGSLMLSGEVGNDEDKAALMEIVVASHPPVRVFNMTITEEKLHKWDKSEADETVLPPGEGPPLTTNWTPNFKDGTMSVKVTNTGKFPAQFEPTPVSHTTPSLAYEHENGLSPFTPDERHDIIVPVVTIVGSTFDDNRLLADNGGFDPPIFIQPNETKTIVISLSMSAENLAKMCDHVIISLYFNNARIYNMVYRIQMKQNEKGVWTDE